MFSLEVLHIVLCRFKIDNNFRIIALNYLFKEKSDRNWNINGTKEYDYFSKYSKLKIRVFAGKKVIEITMLEWPVISSHP